MRYAHRKIQSTLTKPAPKMSFPDRVVPLSGTLTLAEHEGKFGYAWCSPLDNFERAKGRLIAEGRAKSPRTALTLPLEDGRPWWIRAMDRLVSEEPEWVDLLAFEEMIEAFDVEVV